MKHTNVSGEERENRMIPKEAKTPNDHGWETEIEVLFFKSIGGGNLMAVSGRVGGFEKVSFFYIHPT